MVKMVAEASRQIRETRVTSTDTWCTRVWRLSDAINWVDSGSLIPVSKFVSSISLALYISTSDELKFGSSWPHFNLLYFLSSFSLTTCPGLKYLFCSTY